MEDFIRFFYLAEISQNPFIRSYHEHAYTREQVESLFATAEATAATDEQQEEIIDEPMKIIMSSTSGAIRRPVLVPWVNKKSYYFLFTHARTVCNHSTTNTGISPRAAHAFYFYLFFWRALVVGFFWCTISDSCMTVQLS